ncbi:MAG: MarR family transcriptional regulator [Thermoplasmatota archaeon]
MSKELTEEQKKLVEHLIQTGMSKTIAKILVYIAGRDEVKSREIEFSMGLRQPEVSIAIQKMRERGWVVKRDIKKEGKGRPVHGYRLARSMDEIISDIEEKERNSIREIKENIERIKDLTDNIY